MKWVIGIKELKEEQITITGLPKSPIKAVFDYPDIQDPEKMQYADRDMEFKFDITVLGIRATITNKSGRVVKINRREVIFRSPFGRELWCYGKHLLDAIREKSLYLPGKDLELSAFIMPGKTVKEIFIPADLVKFKFGEEYVPIELAPALFSSGFLKKEDHYEIREFLQDLRKPEGFNFELVIPVWLYPSEINTPIEREYAFSFKIVKEEEKPQEEKPKESSENKSSLVDESVREKRKRVLGGRNGSGITKRTIP